MIVLFDIDSTLTHGASCGRRAFEAALDEVLGTRGALEGVALHGRVDRSLVRDAALAAGRWPAERASQAELTARVLGSYRERFDLLVAAEPYHPVPGAAACVTAAQAACELVGLATGNIEPCARAKLRSAGLGALFDGCVGGFGDDGESRAEVVAAGVARARARGARAPRVVVVGDTPLDIAAAHAAGAEAIGVATGAYSVDALRAAGADLVVAHLAALSWR